MEWTKKELVDKNRSLHSIINEKSREILRLKAELQKARDKNHKLNETIFQLKLGSTQNESTRIN
jgi:regulator of replication initiation timing